MGDTTITSDVDVGPIKKRRRFTRPIDKISCVIDLTIPQFNTLKTFYDTDTNGGVEKFELLHPITGVLTNFRFTDSPDIRPLGGGIFQASMNWEVMP